jgi:RNA-directed DNA polymerase
VDTDARTDKVWLLSVQRKLYQRSLENPEGQYREMWGWMIDSRNLRCAWRTVATDKGRRTPGIDGVTVNLRWVQRTDYAMVSGEPSA